MTISSKQKALLHVASAKLGLSEDTYRLALTKIAGVTTSNDLTQDGFKAMMAYFEFCGFRPLTASGASYGHRSGFATPAQIELIRTLWMEIHFANYLDEEALNGWLNKWFKVSALRFLASDTAPKVITALKTWNARAGRGRHRRSYA